MVALYWIVRIYKYLLIAWALMTWIPGLRGSAFHTLLGIPVRPVLAPFDFLTVGGIGLGPIIPLLVLNYLEDWLGQHSGAISSKEVVEADQQPVDPSVNVTDLLPAPAEERSGSTGI